MSDAGVKHCLALMTTGRWVTGSSNADVARKFGVSPETVKEWATSASRIIRLCIEEDGAREDIRARMVATLERIVAQNVVKSGKTAVMAISEQGKLLGLVTQRHAVDMTVKQYEELEPGALRAKLLEQRAKIDEALAKLEAEHPELADPAPTSSALPAGPEGAWRPDDEQERP